MGTMGQQVADVDVIVSRKLAARLEERFRTYLSGEVAPLADEDLERPSMFSQEEAEGIARILAMGNEEEPPERKTPHGTFRDTHVFAFRRRPA